MKKIFLGVLFSFLLMCGCVHAQTVKAGQFMASLPVGSKTVGDAVAAAESKGCSPNTAVTCVIVVDPELSVYPAGPSFPTCARCTVLDYRTAGSNGINGGGGGSGSGFNGVVAKTTNYTAAAGDLGELVTFNCGSACTLTFPATPPGSTWWAAYQNTGSRTVAVSTPGSNLTIPFPNILPSQVLVVYSDGTNYYGGFWANSKFRADALEYDNGTCVTSISIDPSKGTRQKVTLTAGSTCALGFIINSNYAGLITLRVVQSSSASFNGGISGCKWPGGVSPVITQTSGAVDFLSVYMDGTSAYCTFSQNFQ